MQQKPNFGIRGSPRLKAAPSAVRASPPRSLALQLQHAPSNERGKSVYYSEYVDHFRAPILDFSRFEIDNGGDNKEDARNASKKPATFPEILYKMLDEAEEKNFEHICSWRSHGRSFRVDEEQEFVSKVMPEYFTSSRFASFKRQLNLYDFFRLTRGQDRGAYYHTLFLRGRPDLCASIKRTRIKNAAGSPAPQRHPVIQPDFSKYEICEELEQGALEKLREDGKIELEMQTKHESAEQKLRESLDQADAILLPPSGANTIRRDTGMLPMPLPSSRRNQSLRNMRIPPVQAFEDPSMLQMQTPQQQVESLLQQQHQPFQLQQRHRQQQQQLDQGSFGRNLMPASAPGAEMAHPPSSSLDSVFLMEPRPLPQDTPVSMFASQHQNSYVVPGPQRLLQQQQLLLQQQRQIMAHRTYQQHLEQKMPAAGNNDDTLGGAFNSNSNNNMDGSGGYNDFDGGDPLPVSAATSLLGLQQGLLQQEQHQQSLYQPQQQQQQAVDQLLNSFQMPSSLLPSGAAAAGDQHLQHAAPDGQQEHRYFDW